jgi:hypothetical protein
MALTYDLTKIKDHAELPWSTLQNVIFSTMAVGFNEITPKNVAEYVLRLSFVCPEWEAEAEVRSCVGMKTNARNLTKRQFKSQWLKRRAEDFEMKWHGLGYHTHK